MSLKCVVYLCMRDESEFVCVCIDLCVIKACLSLRLQCVVRAYSA